MKTVLLCGTLALAGVSVGCASSSQLAMAETDCNVEYRAEVSATASTLVLPEMPPARGASDEKPIRTFDMRFVRMSQKEASALLGVDARMPDAFTTKINGPKVLPDDFFAGDKGAVISAPRVTVNQGQWASIEIFNEVAYVAGYEVTSAENRLIADPVVNVLRDGILVRLLWEETKGGDRLTLDVWMNDVKRPIGSEDAGMGLDVRVQTPMVSAQTLQVDGEYDSTTTLVVTGLRSENGDALVLFVDGQALKS